jgi:hypothetical protein
MRSAVWRRRYPLTGCVDLGCQSDASTGSADATQPDLRDGGCGPGTFAAFFVQSPAFLAHQPDMQRVGCGQTNAQSRFGVDQAPSDGQIRNLWDPIAPAHLVPPVGRVFEQLRDGDYLKADQGQLGLWLCALDGTQYFNPQQLHCAQCTVRVVNDRTAYAQARVAPRLVAPGENRVLVLEPACVAPQDGGAQQACALRAAKRRLRRKASHFPAGAPTSLGDDLPKAPSAVLCVGAPLALGVHRHTALPSRPWIRKATC